MTHLAFMGFSFPIVEMEMLENSLVVQWLRLHAPSVRGLGSILGQGAISCMPQLRKIPPEPHNEDVIWLPHRVISRIE